MKARAILDLILQFVDLKASAAWYDNDVLQKCVRRDIISEFREYLELLISRITRHARHGKKHDHDLTSLTFVADLMN